MARTRSIALVSPHAWPAHDDLTWRLEHEAHALARRGHRVSILTPATGPELLADSRRRLRALRDGDTTTVLGEAGQVVVVPLGRSLPTGPRRRIGGPLDLAAALEDVLSRVPFDVVHIHEPLAPSPALAALRHARGVTAATFYRPEQLAGVAFVQPLLERAMARLDLWVAASDAARRAVLELFAHDCQVVPGGVDPATHHPAGFSPHGAPGLVIVARGTDRAGLRFALNVVRRLDLDRLGAITVLGPQEAPWLTRAAVPKALRERVQVIPDTGTQARAQAYAGGRIALISAPDDLLGSAVAEAMASGLTPIIPRAGDGDALITHGRDGLALAPFSRDVWAATLTDLVGDPERLAELCDAAARRGSERTWDTVAAELDAGYSEARVTSSPPIQTKRERIVADLRVHAGPELPPRAIVDACLARDVGAVAVIGSSPEAAFEAAAVAAGRLVVIAGQQIRSADGAVIALFVRTAVADGFDLEDTAAAIHAQGGLLMIPHPSWAEPPPKDLLRRHRRLVDCFEMLSGPASATRGGLGEEATRVSQRFGVLAAAGSGATVAEDIGAAHVLIRPFTSARDFLDALVDAEPVQRRRGLRPRVQRERRRPADPAT
jgi:glycosyltransferase involved in cell wall biosynthesis/predicted metal-dependent phosphoesterase TrpH